MTDYSRLLQTHVYTAWVRHATFGPLALYSNYKKLSKYHQTQTVSSSDIQKCKKPINNDCYIVLYPVRAQTNLHCEFENYNTVHLRKVHHNTVSTFNSPLSSASSRLKAAQAILLLAGCLRLVLLLECLRPPHHLLLPKRLS